MQSITFLRLPEVLARTGLSRSSLYEKIDAVQFPKPAPLGDRAVGWIDFEVDEWQLQRIAKRDNKTGGGVELKFEANTVTSTSERG